MKASGYHHKNYTERMFRVVATATILLPYSEDFDMRVADYKAAFKSRLGCEEVYTSITPNFVNDGKYRVTFRCATASKQAPDNVPRPAASGSPDTPEGIAGLQ